MWQRNRMYQDEDYDDYDDGRKSCSTPYLTIILSIVIIVILVIAALYCIRRPKQTIRYDNRDNDRTFTINGTITTPDSPTSTASSTTSTNNSTASSSIVVGPDTWMGQGCWKDTSTRAIGPSNGGYNSTQGGQVSDTAYNAQFGSNGTVSQSTDIGSNGFMTLTQCETFAKQNGFNLIGMQDGNGSTAQCFVGNTATSNYQIYGPVTSNCNAFGSAWVNFVYTSSS